MSKKVIDTWKQNTDRNRGIIVIVVASNFHVNENETLCTRFLRLLYNIKFLFVCEIVNLWVRVTNMSIDDHEDNESIVVDTMLDINVRFDSLVFYFNTESTMIKC